MNKNRRTALKAISTAFALPNIAFAKANLGEPELIVTGARLHTMDDKYSRASAFAVRGDRILAVGSDSDVLNLKGARTKVLDARGKTITPGFIDAHSHPTMANEAVSANVNVRTIGKVQQLLAQQADKTPPGHWVLGHMYDDTKFDEGRPLNRADIDDVVQSHPVMVRHRGGHTAVVNSTAFELLGVDSNTPDPEGGRFFRENGELTGKVAEHAMDQFDTVGQWPVIDRETMRDNVYLTSKRMAATGLTSTTDAAGQAQAWLAYTDALSAGAMDFRLSFMPAARNSIYETMKAASIRSGFGNNMLRVGAVKYVADGSASERTMRMSTPFEGTDDYGIATMSQEEIYSAVDEAVANGFRIGIHANGDVTIDRVLNAYERALKNWQGPNPRFRIEHCSLVNGDLLSRIKASGTVPAPFYTYAHYHGNKWLDYGKERMEWMFAHRSFLDAGIPVAPASDYTPGPYEPLMAIQSMTTRKDAAGRVWGPSQRITVLEALKICTVNGAYASFEENEKGSLSPGKLADFVMLDRDPVATDLDGIKEIKVLGTWLGGRQTYSS
ncbi:MAG: amidohydrolase family protein [Pseudomonadales bacterium]|nr:amidohydrolase family protein [Pseudomonadales bacterium]